MLHGTLWLTRQYYNFVSFKKLKIQTFYTYHEANYFQSISFIISGSNNTTKMEILKAIANDGSKYNIVQRRITLRYY